MRNLIARIITADEGQDMIEYGLLAALISIAAIATLRLLGPLVQALYALIQAALT